MKRGTDCNKMSKNVATEEPETARPSGETAEGTAGNMPGAGTDQKLWLTRPSRSFGSNQVDFGGMMLPASAMSMS